MKRLAHLTLALGGLLPLALVYACGDDLTGAGPELQDGSVVVANDASSGTDSASPSTDSGGTPGDASTADVVVANCSIDFDATITAEITITADDYLRLWVNGVLVDDKETQWGTVDSKTVTLFRNPTRKNVLAVEARNAFNSPGYDRGVLVDMTGVDAGGDAATTGIVSDGSWKIIGTTTDGGLPSGGLPDGGSGNTPAWFDPTFDDSTWTAAFDEGPHGMSPWGAIFGTSTARWLWSFQSSAIDSKPQVDVVYLRKAFYLDMAGNPSTTPTACP